MTENTFSVWELEVMARGVRLWADRAGISAVARDHADALVLRLKDMEPNNEPSPATRTQIEEHLYAYACDRLTADECKAALGLLGHTVDFRTWRDNRVTVTDRAGRSFVAEV